jgi:hypothetical protein
MRLRKLMLGAAAASVLSAVPAAAPAQFNNRTTATLMTLLLAKELGVDSSGLLLLALGGSGYGYTYEEPYYTVEPYTSTVYDLAPVYVIYRERPRYRPIEILRRRRMGWNWQRIAIWDGIPVARYNTLYAQQRFDPNYWGQVVTERQLYVPSSSIVVLRQRRMNWRDVTLATITARQARQPLLTVANNWQRDRNWNRVATTYRVRPADIQRQVVTFRRTRRVPTTWRVASGTTVRRNGTTNQRVIRNGKVVNQRVVRNGKVVNQRVAKNGVRTNRRIVTNGKKTHYTMKKKGNGKTFTRNRTTTHNGNSTIVRTRTKFHAGKSNNVRTKTTVTHTKPKGNTQAHQRVQVRHQQNQRMQQQNHQRVQTQHQQRNQHAQNNKGRKKKGGGG